MNGLPYIEISAALLGVLGTLLLAGRSRMAGWGFVAYLASNAGWLAFSWDMALWSLFAQQLVFTGCSLYGVWTWLVRPKLDGNIGGSA
ncbi:MAG: nicotinamide mononucleotide transporter [Acidovorax sp.]|uniref:nicotinamide mononucleotide transporter n=1 Tax=Acidovorax sp. TaxID=1872122 RepID=UPI00391DF3F3